MLLKKRNGALLFALGGLNLDFNLHKWHSFTNDKYKQNQSFFSIEMKIYDIMLFVSEYKKRCLR